jgi:hypothetical protein
MGFMSKYRKVNSKKTDSVHSSFRTSTSYISESLNRFRLNLVLAIYKSRDSSVGIATGWTTGVRFPAGARDFSLLHRVQTGSGAHPASYTIGTGGSFPGDKAAGAWSDWQSIIKVRFQVLTAVTMKSTGFWDVIPCSLVEFYRPSGRMHCLQVEGLKVNHAIDKTEGHEDGGGTFNRNVGELRDITRHDSILTLNIVLLI